MDDLFDVPLDLIAQSADLSQHRNDRQTSDDMPSVELTLRTSPTSKSADASPIPTVAESVAASACLLFDIATGPPAAEHYYTGSCAAENAPSPEADTVGQARTSRKNMSGRLSVKRDLTAAEIGSLPKYSSERMPVPSSSIIPNLFLRRGPPLCWPREKTVLCRLSSRHLIKCIV
jgi:hypothetical protein